MIRALVTDLNGSFAAMEQHYNPELRGRPIAVCPVLAPNGCVVASSREAKRYGVKCGVLVQDAKRMCPGIHLMEATPGLYVSYQKRMREVFESVLPVHLEPNIDEFRFRLIGDETHPARAREIALDMKRALREAFSPCVTMSAGIAPNFFLAKAATNLQKDDGLVVITDDEVPHALNRFPKLTDLVGISGRMRVRLNAHGIFTVEQLTAASKETLRQVWGGVVGERWWYQMRGHEIEEPKTRTSSLGHSHVLPRERRNREGVKAIAIRLLSKAAARMRSEGYWTSGLSVSVSGRQSWECHRAIPETQDDRDLIPLACGWLDAAEYAWPLKVSVLFYDLRRCDMFTPSLFAHDEAWGRPSECQEPHAPSVFGGSLDHTNNEYGKHRVYVGRIHAVRQNATEKIAFEKRTLFREGRDDVLPTWNRQPHEAPIEALLRAVEAGEALEDLAAYRCGLVPPNAEDEVAAWEPLEERAFSLIAEQVRATLGDREARLHRGEARRLVARLLHRVGYAPPEAELITEVVFRAVDLAPAPEESPESRFHDDDLPIDGWSSHHSGRSSEAISIDRERRFSGYALD